MMMTTEVTQEQWYQVTGKNPSRFKGEGDCDNWDRERGMCPDNPVESVSWYEVKDYIRKLNELSGMKGCERRASRFPIHKRGCYRLPTEAEWEYALRAGSETAYFFGNDSSQLGKYAIYRGNSGGRTHRVKGNRLPNRNGLYDMPGNVWEWVEDAWRQELPGGRDPLVTPGSDRVLRGGCWFNSAVFLRSAYRYGSHPGIRSFDIGFRLVRTL